MEMTKLFFRENMKPKKLVLYEKSVNMKNKYSFLIKK